TDARISGDNGPRELPDLLRANGPGAFRRTIADFPTLHFLRGSSLAHVQRLRVGRCGDELCCTECQIGNCARRGEEKGPEALASFRAFGLKVLYYLTFRKTMAKV